MNLFDLILINPFLNVLVFFYLIFHSLAIPGALSFAIILLTIVIRMALWPLTSVQLKSSQKMAALKPHLDRIKADHGHDKVLHQQEVSKLYKEHGVNPMAGCLPLLLQMPVFIALYQVLLKIVEFDKADFLSGINSRLLPILNLDKAPQTSFLGFSLADKPNQWQQLGFWILLIPLVTGLLQYIQSKMMAPASTAKRGEPAVTSKPEKINEKQGLEDSMAQMQTQMMLIMPLMIAFFSYGFPVGLSLYWNTFTVIGIIQQYIIAGPGALGKYLPKQWQKQN